MSDHQTIIDNVQVADILLTRSSRSTVSETAKGHWDEAYLCYYAHVFAVDWQGRIDLVLADGVDAGLFRVVYNLDGAEKNVLYKAIKRCIFFHNWWPARFWRWLWREKDLSTAQVITKAFNKIGRKFSNRPVSEMTPSDFDKSGITVRIA